MYGLIGTISGMSIIWSITAINIERSWVLCCIASGRQWRYSFSLEFIDLKISHASSGLGHWSGQLLVWTWFLVWTGHWSGQSLVWTVIGLDSHWSGQGHWSGRGSMVLTGVIGLDRGHWSGRGSLVWTEVIGLDGGHWSGRGSLGVQLSVNLAIQKCQILAYVQKKAHSAILKPPAGTLIVPNTTLHHRLFKCLIRA